MNAHLASSLMFARLVLGFGGCSAEAAPCPTFEGGSYTLTVLASDDACDLGFESQDGLVIQIGDSERCDGRVEQSGCDVALIESSCAQPNGDTIVQNIVLRYSEQTGTFDGTIALKLFTPEGTSQCEGTYEVSLAPVR